jgi:uncharacterized membrane protein (DUF485 family)
MMRELGIIAGAFAAGTLAAELLGADNLGIAIGFGQLTFTVAVVAVVLRAGRSR